MSVAWSIPRKEFCGLPGVAEDRLADATWVDVIEIEVQLCDHTDIGAALPVDRYQRLDAKLKAISDPYHTGIDGARRRRPRRERIRHRRLQIGFDQRDQMIDEIRQAEIHHRRFQIRHAVLDGSTPVQNARMIFGIDRRIAAVGIDAEGAGRVPARDRVTELAGERDRPDPRKRIRKIAETFAEIHGRCVGIEGIGADAGRATAAPFDGKADRHHELVLRVPVDAVFERGFPVLESIGARPGRASRPTEQTVGRADGYREVFRDTFGKFSGKIALVSYTHLRAHETDSY